MADTAQMMAQMLTQQIAMLHQIGSFETAAQAADEVRHLELLAEIHSDS